MQCSSCPSSVLFVFSGETASDSVKRCCLCGLESPLSPEDWLEHQMDESRSTSVSEALVLIRAGETGKAVQQLAGLVSPADHPLANRALRALGSTRGDEAATALDDIAARTDGAIRESALRQLGALRLESAARRLLKWYDKAPAVRELARRSLIATGDAAVGPLAERLADCRPGDDRPWEKLLCDLGTEPARQAVVHWRVATCLDEVARETLTPVEAGDRLRGLGLPAAAALRDGLQHDSSRARLAALRALVQMGGKLADEALSRCRDDSADEVADYARYELSRERRNRQQDGW